MNQELTKETAKEIMETEGEVRGVVFKTDTEYILKEKGEEGLRKLEEELESLGCPIRYKKIETMSFYPVGLRALSLLAAKKVFDFDDEKIKEMGVFATKFSLMIKLFIKYVFSPRKVIFESGPKIWRGHWTIGKLTPIEFNEGKKYAVLRLENFNLHPIYCCYFEGYLRGLFQMIIKSPKIVCRERKCVFREDEHHEYLLKWE